MNKPSSNPQTQPSKSEDAIINKARTEFQAKWIKDGFDEKTIEYAQHNGKALANFKMTTSQIRNVFGEIRRIEQKGLNNEVMSFYMLKPKMAYNIGRLKQTDSGINGLKLFQAILEKAIEEVKPDKTEVSNERFNRFVALMEALLAYHRAEGGKEN